MDHPPGLFVGPGVVCLHEWSSYVYLGSVWQGQGGTFSGVWSADFWSGVSFCFCPSPHPSHLLAAEPPWGVSESFYTTS